MSTLITNKKSKHIIRGDTAASWASSNPILLKNELAYDETSKKFKMGDGTTPWNSLSYVENDSGDSIEFTTGGVSLEPGSFLVDLTLTEEHYQLFLKNKSAPLVVPSMYYDGDDVWITDESLKYTFTPVIRETYYNADEDKSDYYVMYMYFDGYRIYDIYVWWGEDSGYYVDDYYEEHITESRHPIGISGYVDFVEGTADLNLSEACPYVMQDKTLPITIGSIHPNVPSGIIYYPYEWVHNDNGFLIAYRNIELTYVEIIVILWNQYDASECIVDEVRYEELSIDNPSSGTSNKVIIPLTHINSTTVSLLPEEYSEIIKETEHPEDIIIKLLLPDEPCSIYIPFSILTDGPEYRFYTYSPYYGEFLIELDPYTGNVSYYSAYTNTSSAPGVIEISGEVDSWGEFFRIIDFDIPASAYNQFKFDFSKPIKVGGHCFQVEYIDFYSGEEALVTYYSITGGYIHRIVIYWTSDGGSLDEMYAEPLVSGSSGGDSGGDSSGGSSGTSENVVDLTSLGLVPMSSSTGTLTQEQLQLIRTADKVILGSPGELETYLPLCNKTIFDAENNVIIYLFAGYGMTDSEPKNITFIVYPDGNYAYTVTAI